MSEHSPGPWMANGRDVRDAFGRSIAGAHEWDTRPKAPIEQAMQRATVIANARLIAAAPEMLALLREYDAVDTEQQARAWWATKQALVARIDGVQATRK